LWGSGLDFTPSSSLTAPAIAAATASNASQANDEELDIKKMERWTKEGKAMVTAPLRPGWSVGDEMLQHGEAMIREQEDLQSKKRLYQIIAMESGADEHSRVSASPMRAHLAGKIETRLKDEKLREAQAAMEVHQACMNIRKHISGMSNARKNLNTLRIETQHTLQPLRSDRCPAGLSLGFSKMYKQRMHGHTEAEDEDDNESS